jgi:hypothetical protein
MASGSKIYSTTLAVLAATCPDQIERPEPKPNPWVGAYVALFLEIASREHPYTTEILGEHLETT